MNSLFKLGRGVQNSCLNFVLANGQTQMLAVRPISVSSPLRQQGSQDGQPGGKKKWVIGALLVGGAGALYYFTRGKGEKKCAKKVEEQQCTPQPGQTKKW